MEQAIIAMVSPVVAELENDVLSYKVELPLAADEHKGVDWRQESEKYLAFADRLEQQSTADGYTQQLVQSLEALSQVLLAVKQSFQQYKDSNLFADYGEREFAYFKANGWVRYQDKLVDEFNEDFTSDDGVAYFGSKLQESLRNLASVAEKAVDVQNNLIYYEALGHKLWAQSHKPEDAVAVDSTLAIVAACEYFGTQAETPIIFLPKKINPSQSNEAMDGLTLEERFRELHRHKVIQIRTVFKDNYIKTICQTSCYFGPKMNAAWLQQFFDDMLSEETLIEPVYELFTVTMRLNTLCRIIGEFWDLGLYADSVKSASDLAECFSDRKPNRDSRARYIRDHFPVNNPLGVWIRDYVTREV